VHPSLYVQKKFPSNLGISITFRVNVIHTLKPLSPRQKELAIQLRANRTTRREPATEGRQVHRLVGVIHGLKPSVTKQNPSQIKSPNLLGLFFLEERLSPARLSSQPSNHSSLSSRLSTRGIIPPPPKGKLPIQPHYVHPLRAISDHHFFSVTFFLRGLTLFITSSIGINFSFRSSSVIFFISSTLLFNSVICSFIEAWSNPAKVISQRQ